MWAKMNFIKIVKIYNKAMTWTLAILMCYLFMKAWQNNMVWNISINVYGEGIFEVVMLLFWLFSIVILTIPKIIEENEKVYCNN